MTGTRRDGIYLLVLGCVAFVLFGTAIEVTSPASMTDFRIHYYSARCLLQKHDPYKHEEMLRAYRAEEGERPTDSSRTLAVITKYIYPPVVFLLTTPFALLPFGLAHVFWMIANALSLILAALLTWDIAAPHAPVISGALIGFMIGNSELVLVTGNVGGIAVGLCVVAVWCFMKEKLGSVGVVCLALSLILKPHDSCLIWLCFALAGGVYRRRALQTLGVAAIIGIPSLAWAATISPHWMAEMRANIAELSVHGGIADPGPSSSGAHAMAMQINLQTAVSMFRDDPHFYNPVSYLICGILIAFWGFEVMRIHSNPRRTWIALAAAAALTMLPIYHRQDDAKLLLIAIPTCALIWVEEGPVAKWALAITAGGVIVTAEIPWAIILILLRHLKVQNTQFTREVIIGVQVLPIPAMLLLVGIFYLWLLARTQLSSGYKVEIATDRQLLIDHSESAAS